jgi:hypothetical protein
MSNQCKTFADPIRTVMVRLACLYCGKKETYWAKCMYQCSILACDEHKEFADRDVKAWNHRNNYVRWSDYTNDPLFKETGILTNQIIVKRTNGEIENDWELMTPDYFEMASVTKCNEEWCIPVKKLDMSIKKYIPVKDLKISLTEDNHALVDDFIAKLNDGFYKKENLEYNQLFNAYTPTEENPKSITNLNTHQEVIDTVYVEGHGIVRAFIPEHQPIVYNGDIDSTDPTTA